MSTGLKANSDGSAAIQVGGSDAITLTSGGAATFLTSPTTVQAGTVSAPSITFSGDTNTGIYSPGADTIAFTEGGVESMRIDSSGNLGLGVTPSAWGTNYKALEVKAVGTALASNGVANTLITNNAYDIGSGSWRYAGSYGAGLYNIQTGEHRWYTAPSGTAGNAITFTQAMSLDNNGSLVVTTRALATVGNFISNVAGDVAQPAVFIQKYDNNSTTSQIFMRFVINNQGNACGQITANGANTAAFGTVSDRRIKENITELPLQLQNILALRPVEFDYVESRGGGHQIGFIAQEMQEVYPDVVSPDDSEEQILSITGWSKTEARLVKAIQEQQQMIEELKAKVAALEGAA